MNANVKSGLVVLGFLGGFAAVLGLFAIVVMETHDMSRALAPAVMSAPAEDIERTPKPSTRPVINLYTGENMTPEMWASSRAEEERINREYEERMRQIREEQKAYNREASQNPPAGWGNPYMR